MIASLRTWVKVGPGGGGGGGVTSLNTLTGSVTISAGANITLTPSGNNIAIASASGGTCTPPGTQYSILYDTITGCGDLASLGTTTTVRFTETRQDSPLFGSVVSADLNITSTTCTNQFLRVISSSAGGTCKTVVSTDVDNSIALTGTDINTSNQVTVTHIASSTNTDLAAFNSTGNMVNYAGASSCTNQFFTAFSAAGALDLHGWRHWPRLNLLIKERRQRFCMGMHPANPAFWLCCSFNGCIWPASHRRCGQFRDSPALLPVTISKR